jgi:S-adenosylmethionine-diacylglycerol 3-amino-3-carboxypropyl transferase
VYVLTRLFAVFYNASMPNLAFISMIRYNFLMANEQLVLGAVQNEKTTTKQGILQKMFAVWFDAFVYNQIWEDPRVDLQALKLDENSRVLTISSGGCNALNYLVESPQTVTAVDLNRHHIYLLRLKKAAIENLPNYDDFFALFGFGKDARNVKNYNEFIAPNLDTSTREFWDKNIKIFKFGGLYEHSRNGYFLRFFHRFSSLIGLNPDKTLRKTPFSFFRQFYYSNAWKIADYNVRTRNSAAAIRRA